MMLDEIHEQRAPSPSRSNLPETRPSFLDPGIASEPWIDACRDEQIVVLYLLNRPIALLSASALDLVPLTMQLDRLRHRAPRQAVRAKSALTSSSTSK
jgi:hypothetical protein